MLKITVQSSSDHAANIRLDGKLMGEWVNEFEKVCHGLSDAAATENLTLDLSGVTYVDADGKKLLTDLLRQGAQVREPQLLVKYILDEIRAGR